MSRSGIMTEARGRDLAPGAAPLGREGASGRASDAALPLNPTKVVGVLALGWLVILAASFTGLMSVLAADLSRAEVGASLEHLSMLTKLLLKFDVGNEQTVAAWFSSALFLLCGLVLLHIAALKRRFAEPYATHWLFLALIFFGLSADDTIALHESLIDPMRALFDAGGIFRYAWVIPAIAGVLVVGAAYLGFVFHLEPLYRNRIILAGAIFLTGAIGFEMMEGGFASFYATHLLIYEIAVHVEDTLEFAGVLLFLHTLLRYAQAYCRTLALDLR